jgi:pilus assembly protein CpaC
MSGYFGSGGLRAAALVMAGLLGFSCGAALADAPATLAVDVGTHKLLRLPATPARLAVGEPRIADVNLINGRDLLVNGKSVGVTSLIVWLRGSKGVEPQEYRVEVGGLAGNSASLMEHRGAVLGAGGASASAPPESGAAAGAAAGGTGGAAQAGSIVDRSLVNLETQVMSQVKIVEVTRSVAQEYGLNVLGGKKVFGSITGPSGLSGVQSGGTGASSTTFTSSSGFLPYQDAFNFIFGNRNWLGVLSLLEGKGLARTLAEPSLTAMSGQTASFLAGGEFPIPVVQGGGGGGAGGNAITIQFKEYGVRLSLTPTVLASSRIALKVSPEVSDLDFANGLTLSGATVPALIVRRTDTMVELGDGETFVLSGLITNNLKKNVDKIPWLGDVPILGAFFRDTTFSRAEKELIMVVTPHLVRPIARGAALPSLPGAASDRFSPSFASTMFMDNGSAGEVEFGYSR